MGTGQIIYVAIVIVLFVICSAYMLQIVWLLMGSRSDSLNSVLTGRALTRRVLLGNVDGLDPETSTRFFALRGSLFNFMIALAVVFILGLAVL